MKKEKLSEKEIINYLQDTLYVINGKWKLPILIAIKRGNTRFRDIQRYVPPITSKVLSSELKLLEQNKLINRNVYDDTPVVVKYTLAEYSQTLFPMIEMMVYWGRDHRKVISGN
ncbi:helix-turn-helix transcriptional regulator [Algoriphagus sp. AGSA1]|uniref:winged helix-turn-helix transcriptional regulator n=1 Tax=Algoriphagus sp. AGSA1 TaxID=2907213 RepID=UPI001F37E544|nr:helix-turn-helix domain-containing protein [Algoriphagus sp. AGSA1]MCE7057059.1 helix-turn-helix transcriptional regulator [Algoriphagus sp. AGSA1]